MPNRHLLSLISIGVATIVMMVVVHESAHYVAARAIGIPADSVRYSWCPQGPCVLMDPAALRPGVSVVHYAGGLTVGLILGGMYAATIAYLRRRRTLFPWLLGLLFIWLAAYQLANGIVEGAYHDIYVRGPWWVTMVPVVVWAGAGGVLHTWVIAPPQRMAFWPRRGPGQGA